MLGVGQDLQRLGHIATCSVDRSRGQSYLRPVDQRGAAVTAHRWSEPGEGSVEDLRGLVLAPQPVEVSTLVGIALGGIEGSDTLPWHISISSSAQRMP
jgi:hypothetical protein